MARVRAVVTLALLMLAAAAHPVVPLGPAWGVSLGERPQHTVTYDVRVRGAVQADVGVFARIAARTFNDRRGWSLGGGVRFSQVASGGAFTLWLAAPDAMRTFASVCSARYSCRSGDDVVINDERWRLGTATWPTVREYRSYVLNHELGHWLGLRHAGCPRAGAPAPVMQQQSKGLDGCRTSTWPLEPERRAAATHLRAGLRTRAPVLVTVQRAALGGTEVHSLSGASRYTTWLAHSLTALPQSEGRPWTFRVADHDRDGVDDLYVIEHETGSPVEVHVLDGAMGYLRSLLDTRTPLTVTESDRWSFHVADQDGDGHLDLIGVDSQGATGTEVHVLDGGRAFGRFRLHARTALHRTSLEEWAFQTGDHDRDGVPDLYAVSRHGGSGGTEVHVLSGATGFGRWLAHAATPLGPTTRQKWSFEVADTDGNGVDDLVTIDRRGASGRTELHVLDRTYRRWILHTATARGASLGEERWSFDVAG